MKISIGINGFKKWEELEKREKLCIESLIKVKGKNNDIKLFNLCFENENIAYDNFITLNQLTKKSNDVIYKYFQHEGLQKEYKLRQHEIDNNKKELPSVKEIFDVLANTDCDYFLFLNNDIILSNRVLKLLNESNIESFVISRGHIYDINSLQDTPILESYSVHGFDAFLIKKAVWLECRNNFPDLILGRFYWDTFYATMLLLLTNTKIVNKLPPACFHIEHNSKSSADTIENYYNEDIFKRYTLITQLWFTYVQNIPLKRPTVNGCKWYQPFSNEEELEKQIFKQFDKPILSQKIIPLEVTKEESCDLFVPVAEKDEIKLPFVLEYAKANLKIKNIFICSPHKIVNKLLDKNITYLNDKDIIDIDNKSFIGFRPNWTYQQFLKLFFCAGTSEYFFALDADTIVIKPLKLFENNKPIWYYGWNQNHFPYFLFNKKIFNLNKTLTHTGIGDLGLFNTQIIKTFLQSTGCATPKELLFKIGPYTNPFFHFSEYETYANFTHQYYPNLYNFLHIEQLNLGRDLNQGENWTVKDIKDSIDKNKNIDKCILSLHSWKI